jgi:hypothetical protein
MTHQKHDFQPILNEDQYNQAITYIAQQAIKLALKVLNKNLTIDTITVFSQTKTEYDFIAGHLRVIGSLSNFSHGETIYIETDKTIGNNKIMLLGVRQPDATKPEVGYADYPVSDYKKIKKLHKGIYIKEILSGAGMHLLELAHPDFDVRGYVVAEKDHDI